VPAALAQEDPELGRVGAVVDLEQRAEADRGLVGAVVDGEIDDVGLAAAAEAHPPAGWASAAAASRSTVLSERSDQEALDGTHGGIAMTDTSTADVPTTANFINPETMHRPTGYTHVVEVTAGRPVYIAGQVALDPTGALVGPGDIRAQTRQVFDNLRAALQAVGASFDQVVKLNYYLVDAAQLPVVREVRDEYLNPRQLPASTAVEVRRLFRDDILIEIEAVAVTASFQPLRSTV
jgi:enamine deaminase RidA (YjgF/YER057c/UK114 family)